MVHREMIIELMLRYRCDVLFLNLTVVGVSTRLEQKRVASSSHAGVGDALFGPYGVPVRLNYPQKVRNIRLV